MLLQSTAPLRAQAAATGAQSGGLSAHGRSVYAGRVAKFNVFAREGRVRKNRVIHL
jgi:hypothetical protein